MLLLLLLVSAAAAAAAGAAFLCVYVIVDCFAMWTAAHSLFGPPAVVVVIPPRSNSMHFIQHTPFLKRVSGKSV